MYRDYQGYFYRYVDCFFNVIPYVMYYSGDISIFIDIRSRLYSSYYYILLLITWYNTRVYIPCHNRREEKCSPKRKGEKNQHRSSTNRVQPFGWRMVTKIDKWDSTQSSYIELEIDTLFATKNVIYKIWSRNH